MYYPEPLDHQKESSVEACGLKNVLEETIKNPNPNLFSNDLMRRIISFSIVITLENDPVLRILLPVIGNRNPRLSEVVEIVDAKLEKIIDEEFNESEKEIMYKMLSLAAMIRLTEDEVETKH